MDRERLQGQAPGTVHSSEVVASVTEVNELAKRYVFWRMPNGKPYRKEDSRFAPTELLAEHGKSASVVEKTITYPLRGFPREELAIRSSVVVIGPDDRELNEGDSWAIVQKAIINTIRESGGNVPIEPTGLLKKADKEAQAFFRTSPRDYVLVSSLSIHGFPATKIRIGDNEITSMKERGRRFLYPKALTKSSRQARLQEHTESTDYLPIKVKTSGRSHQEATDRALDAIDVLRGLWTLFGTHGTWTMHMGPKGSETVGVIHTAPIHTLHDPDGTLVADVYWYQPNYLGDRKCFKPTNGWSNIEKHRRWATRKLRTLPYGRDIEQLIVRYVKALDHVDGDLALLELWSLLEKITDTIGANYDETIERVSWVFKDRKAARQEMNSLRLRRNMYVHSARSGNDSDQATYLIKSFVEPHLIRLIRNDFDVVSLEDYGKYLALPTDVEELKRQKMQRQRAQRMFEAEANGGS